jgi:thiamine pyrophosphokinase
VLADVEVDGWIGAAHVSVVRRRRELAGRPGLLLSLLAWGGTAFGVATEGLRWPLHDATLLAGSAWGTSNEFVGDTAAVSLTSGVLTAIAPDVTALHPVIHLL